MTRIDNFVCSSVGYKWFLEEGRILIFLSFHERRECVRTRTKTSHNIEWEEAMVQEEG